MEKLYSLKILLKIAGGGEMYSPMAIPYYSKTLSKQTNFSHQQTVIYL